MLHYRSIKPLLYVAMFSLYATALTFELYIYVLIRGYGDVQTVAVSFVLAIAIVLTLVAPILAAWLWILKRAPHWVERLKQYGALRRAEHNLAKQNANDYIRQYIRQYERRSDVSEDS